MRYYKKDARDYSESIVSGVRNPSHTKFAANKDSHNSTAGQHYQQICSGYQKGNGEIV